MPAEPRGPRAEPWDTLLPGARARPKPVRPRGTIADETTLRDAPGPAAGAPSQRPPEDQRPEAGSPTLQRANVSTFQRGNAPTNERDNAPTDERPDVPTLQRGNEPTSPRSGATTVERANGPTDQRSGEPTGAAAPTPPRRRPSAATELRDEAVRLLGRPPTSGGTWKLSSEETSWAEDVQHAVRRDHGVKLSKQDLLRLGLNMLLIDHRERGAESVLGQLIRRRSTGGEEAP